jgi:signal peptidase I
MKKTGMVAVILCVSLIIALIIARLTGMLQFYSIPVSSMSPTLTPGSNIVTSNLVKPGINDIVVFSRVAGEFDGAAYPGEKITCTYRLVAKGGDRLVLKNGLVYTNGRYADDSTRLKFFYAFSSHKTSEILKTLGKNENEMSEFEMYSSTDSSTILALSFADYNKIKNLTPLVKQISPATVETSLYKNSPYKNWSADNYGPITIPANTFFLLGDNRNMALDSRFIGPVPIGDVKGVMIGRY